jgi:hypothetical protein
VRAHVAAVVQGSETQIAVSIPAAGAHFDAIAPPTLHTVHFSSLEYILIDFRSAPGVLTLIWMHTFSFMDLIVAQKEKIGKLIMRGKGENRGNKIGKKERKKGKKQRKKGRKKERKEERKINHCENMKPDHTSDSLFIQSLRSLHE